MKKLTIQKSVVAIALLLLPMMSFADAFSFLKLTSKANKIITLRVGSAQSDMTHIKLKDQFGHVFYSESIKNVEGILKNFDLSYLSTGQYEIELENNMNIVIMPVNVTWDSVSIAEEQFTTYYKPFIQLKQNGMVDLNFLNVNTVATSVRIIDNDGNIVYKGDLGKDSAIKKRYDFSLLKKGEYQFIVDNDGRNFIKTISL